MYSCVIGIGVQRGRPEYCLVAQRAQSVPRERTNQIVQVRLDDKGKGRGSVTAEQIVHQGRRAFRAGARASQKPTQAQTHPARPRTHAGTGMYTFAL